MMKNLVQKAVGDSFRPDKIKGQIVKELKARGKLKDDTKIEVHYVYDGNTFRFVLRRHRLIVKHWNDEVGFSSGSSDERYFLQRSALKKFWDLVGKYDLELEEIKTGVKPV